ncbi:MAG: hypothetical protein B6243_11070 [Anaerolineaceae bacterium 4572_5.2]|nr:MAG: hypothetical protein B6243_11070 [Anaerolineaceae bacterium 4572_5.2]
MSNNQLQNIVTANVWKSIAKSDLDFSGIERDDLDKLVQFVVDAALEAVDDHLEEVYEEIVAKEQSEQPAALAAATDDDDDDEEEEVLWEGRPFMSLVTRYVITNQRVRIIEGLIGKTYEDIELVRIQDMDFTQSMTERALNLGDISILSHDPSEPDAMLRNIKNPHNIHEILRRAVVKARKTHRLSYREEM